MATKVIDSWALMALFNDEPAADAVEKILEQATVEKHKLLMSVVNWGEVYYSVMRGASAEMAEQKLKEMDAMPIEIVGADIHLTKQAAFYKATKKMSYADCFGVALAKNRNAEFITGDSEFKEIEREIKINWLK
jgi:ribonuclease VapC